MVVEMISSINLKQPQRMKGGSFFGGYRKRAKENCSKGSSSSSSTRRFGGKTKGSCGPRDTKMQPSLLRKAALSSWRNLFHMSDVLAYACMVFLPHAMDALAAATDIAAVTLPRNAPSSVGTALRSPVEFARVPRPDHPPRILQSNSDASYNNHTEKEKHQQDERICRDILQTVFGTDPLSMIACACAAAASTNDETAKTNNADQEYILTCDYSQYCGTFCASTSPDGTTTTTTKNTNQQQLYNCFDRTDYYTIAVTSEFFINSLYRGCGTYINDDDLLEASTVCYTERRNNLGEIVGKCLEINGESCHCRQGPCDNESYEFRCINGNYSPESAAPPWASFVLNECNANAYDDIRPGSIHSLLSPSVFALDACFTDWTTQPTGTPSIANTPTLTPTTSMAPTTPILTALPTQVPTLLPTRVPTTFHSFLPTTTKPTTPQPTTASPTILSPTTSPPTAAPTSDTPTTPIPTTQIVPQFDCNVFGCGVTRMPATLPTGVSATLKPTNGPTDLPATRTPTVSPSRGPTAAPTPPPSTMPSLKPTTVSPSVSPSTLPSLIPTSVPTPTDFLSPSLQPQPDPGTILTVELLPFFLWYTIHDGNTDIADTDDATTRRRQQQQQSKPIYPSLITIVAALQQVLVMGLTSEYVISLYDFQLRCSQRNGDLFNGRNQEMRLSCTGYSQFMTVLAPPDPRDVLQTQVELLHMNTTDFSEQFTYQLSLLAETAGEDNEFSGITVLVTEVQVEQPIDAREENDDDGLAASPGHVGRRGLLFSSISIFFLWSYLC